MHRLLIRGRPGDVVGHHRCVRQEVGQDLGLDHGQAAPASVQRVGGGVAVADGVEPGHQRAVVGVEEPAATVDQAAHHLDVGDRLGTTVDVGGGGGDESGGGEEAVGVEQQPTHLGVAAADGERDREGVVVAGEHAVLEVAQVRSDHDRRRRLVEVEQSEEAGQVDDPGVLLGLGDLHAVGGEKGGHVAAAAAGVDDHVRVEGGPVRQGHADDQRNPVDGLVRGHQRGDGATVDQLDGSLGQRHPPQDPLEGGATTGQGGQVLVAGLGLQLHPLGGHLEEAHLGRAGVEQRGDDVGVAVAQQVAESGQERVRVADLGRAVPVPLEGAVRVGGKGGVVTFDDRHAVPGPGGAQRGPQPADAGADDHDPCHVVLPLDFLVGRGRRCPSPTPVLVTRVGRGGAPCR